jgi:hypothetical protein
MIRKRPDERECKWGCGTKSLPGPISMHERSCAKNPDQTPTTISQPTGECKWGCGKVTTLGALKTHELYGCKQRRVKKSLNRAPCPTCGKAMLPGPLALHRPACSG